jgi:hypothetical protein
MGLYHVEVHMRNLLVSTTAVILQDVVFLSASSLDELLGDRLFDRDVV